MNKLADSIIAKFWSKVNKRGPIPKHMPHLGCCWIWTAGKFKAGYGAFYGGYSHRFSWQIHNGKIPDGIQILHKCDNPSCVRPFHLFDGTRFDNMKDKENKGRGNHAIGHKNGRAKLTVQQIPEIRNLIELGMNNCRIGKMFKVDHSVIRQIRTGKAWLHVK